MVGRPTQSRLTIVGKCIFPLLLLITGGCAPGVSTAVSPSLLPKSSPKAGVTQTTDYGKAKALFARGDYAGADTILTRLLADPERTAADRTFLQRQIAICQESTKGKTIVQSEKKMAAVPVRTISNPPVSTVDCGPRALLLLCQSSKPPISASLPALRKAAEVKAPRGSSLEGMTRAAKSVGFVPEAVQMDRDALANLSTPAIAWVDGNHYIAVYRVNRSLRGIDYDTATIQDPNKKLKEDITLANLLSRSGGVFMTLTPTQ